MQRKLFTAGAVLVGLSVTGLALQHTGSEPAAAELPVHTGPTTLPTAAPSKVVPTTTARASSTSSAPQSTTTSPTATTTSTQARILPSYPPAVPGLLARAIAGRDTAVCGLFTTAATQQLAAGTGTSNCPTAIEALAAKVTNASSYGNPAGAGDPQSAGDRRVTVDACHLTWTKWGGSGNPPGPQIGRLTLEQQPDSVGYLIAGYQPC